MASQVPCELIKTNVGSNDEGMFGKMSEVMTDVGRGILAQKIKC